ncbi:DNA polymerase Y family protein [Frankia sp. EI5c]|uniref:DNA polymerase Y family protein n=1 Tax=Frankia sp. EI5c TaxID=683316 RepID=UPI000824BD67
MLAVHIPDWPVVASGEEPNAAVAVLAANQVRSAGATARAQGVHPGLRRREAQARCPELVLVPADPDRDARVFEPIVAAVETVVPGVEVTEPGNCLVRSRGAARYFGGDGVVAAQVRGAVEACLARAGLHAVVRVGVADGPFAALVAARADQVVPPGGTPDFLAPLSVDLLDQPELADVLRRLGLVTLGAFARLPAADVLARFGPAGALAHGLASGEDERPLLPREQPLDLSVAVRFEPPVEHVEQAVFAARRLAEEAHEQLRDRGLACTRIVVEAETEHGERRRRVWRHDGPLSVSVITDRVRWQLDGWLAGTGREGEPTSGLVLVRLTPEGLLPGDGRQLGLWGEPGAAAGRVGRALTRIQGLLGPDAVTTPVVVGGRDPARRVRLAAWGEPRDGAENGGSRGRAGASGGAGGEIVPPWPGAVPPPAPATVHDEPLPALVLDEGGEPVGVSGRCAVTAPPAWLSVGGAAPLRITGWAGPWPVDERWWDAAGRRRARFQVVAADGSASLLFVEIGRWWLEAAYD